MTRAKLVHVVVGRPAQVVAAWLLLAQQEARPC